MKKILFLAIVLILTGLNSFSQWTVQQPLVGVNTFNSVFFADANTGYLAGDNGFIIKTNDGGITYTNVSIGWNFTLASVYFTSANRGFAVGGAGTIIKTTNGGTTWTLLISGTSQFLLSVYFTAPSTGYVVGANGKILKTTDGGVNWVAKLSGTTSLLRSVYFTDANTGYVAGENGTILKTIDGGTTWTGQSSGTTTALESVYFTDANTGYAVGLVGTIIKTTNGGATWTGLSSGTTNPLISVYFTNSNNGYAVGAVTSGGGPFVLKTTDGGMTWTNPWNSWGGGLRSVYFTSANTGYAVGYQGIILKTIDGGTTWTRPPKETELLSSVCFTDANTGYAVGYGYDGTNYHGRILKTTDAGENWTLVFLDANISSYSSVCFTDANTGYVVGINESVIAGGYYTDIIMKTIDGGTTWTSQSTGTMYPLSSVYFTNSNTGYAVGRKILKTTNGGATWTAQNPGIPAVYYASVFFTGSNTGYAVGGNSVVSGYGAIINTINGGTTWTPQLSGLAYNLNSVYFTNANTGYAVGEWGIILKTINGGTNWEPLSSGTSDFLSSIYFTDANTGYAVGGGILGGTILKTTNGGTTWTPSTSNISVGLNSIFFTDVNTGYVVGENGIIIKTTRSGEIVPPTLSTTSATAITATSAMSGGNITNDGYAPVTARGVCVALWDYPDLTDGGTTDGTGRGSFTSFIDGLAPATNYHVRAYATNLIGTSYGNDVSFTTPCPATFSLPFSQVFGTTDQPSCWTQIDHAGSGQIWQFGEITGWNPAPALSWNYAFLNSAAYGTGTSQNADLITPLLDLSGYSTVTLGFSHYFRSFFGSSGKISYSINNGASWTTIQTYTSTTANPAIFSMSIPAVAGQSQVKFKWNYTGGNGYYWAIDDILITGVGTPAISSMIPYSITATSAISGGTITSDRGASVTARGVCWGFSENPNVAGSHTSDGSGIGTFTSAIAGLSPNTTYHVRAYATNSSGTSYGDNISFTTECPPISSLPLHEGFDTTFLPNCWDQADHQGYGQIWQFGVMSGNGAVLTGNYAFLDSDGYGTGNTQDADLISPLFDLSGYSEVVLGFNYYFRSYPLSSGTLSYSINNGNTWDTIQTFTATSANPAIFSLSIPDAAQQSQVKFKWNYTGTWGWYWAIDNIQVTGVLTDKALTNMTIGSGTTTCYSAIQTITVAGNGSTFTVQNGGEATLIAGQKIRLLPGTIVQPGGNLWGYITTSGAYCVTPYPPVNASLIVDNSSPAIETESTLFRVYPNPTTGKFTLEMDADLIDVQATVRIYGMLGNEVHQGKIAGNRKTEFSLSERPNGIYIIQVTMGDRIATAKIIKQ